jgi:hypothetical protein
MFGSVPYGGGQMPAPPPNDEDEKDEDATDEGSSD